MTIEPAKFTECHVAFLDLMGFSDIVKKAGVDEQLYRDVVTALQVTKRVSPFVNETRDLKTGETSRFVLQVQAFSDSLALFVPVHRNNLSWFLSSIFRLHNRLIKLGIPLRGGITVGGMHWDPIWSESESEQSESQESNTPIAFGPGLVECYSLESGVAVYPRILISERLYELILQEKWDAFPLGEGRIENYCRQDGDGLYHFDVLNSKLKYSFNQRITKTRDENGKGSINFEEDVIKYPEWLAFVRSFVERNLSEVTSEKLLAKYRWFARYYNEKVRESGCGEPIPIFRDEIPKDMIPVSVKMQKGSGE